MAASYAFQVTLDQADATYFAQNGFCLCVSKQTNNQASGVVWLAIPVEGTNIGIQWSENYSIYFTNTANQAGATINQTTANIASIGDSYTYNNATFTVGTQPAPTGSIVISNQYKLLNPGGNFGLAQSATINSNALPATPINITTIPYLGSGTYTPNVTVTFGFTNTITSPGVISNINATTQTITLTSGTTPTWGYNSGVWTLQSSKTAK